MKTFPIYTLLLLVLMTACKKEDITTTSTQTSQLVLDIQDQFTTPPAKVSVFFSVATKDGQPVAGLTNDDFVIFEKGRNDTKEKEISKDEAERQISSRKQRFSFNTLLVLDLSASVTNNNLAELREAASTFVHQVMAEEDNNAIKMSILWFDGEDNLHVLAPLTSSRAELDAAILDIHGNMSQDNSTDLYGAVLKTTERAEILVNQNANIISAVSVVLFTDGTDQAARYTRSAALNAVKGTDSKVTYYAIGLGGEIDEPTLRGIGKDGTALAQDATSLLGTFETVADQVNQVANSYYLFEYCSPKRDGSGMNDLRIQVATEGMRGSVMTSFDASNFSGGCSL